MNEKHIIKFLNNKHERFVVKIKYLKIKFENMKNKLNEWKKNIDVNKRNKITSFGNWSKITSYV